MTKSNIVPLASLFNEKAVGALTDGCTHVMLETLEDMYKAVFVYCAVSAASPTQETDYNFMDYDEREMTTNVYGAIKAVLTVMVAYDNSEGIKEQKISPADAAMIATAMYELLDYHTGPTPRVSPALEHCMEQMLMVAVIERPAVNGQCVGEKERNLYYYYTKIRDIVRGWKVQAIAEPEQELIPVA